MTAAMTDIQSSSSGQASQPRQIPNRSAAIDIPSLAPLTLPTAASSRTRNSYLNLDAFSPVNQNGSFEFDRVLKSGVVQKRTRKTKAWKSIYLVLRPHTISIYKDSNEEKLRHKVNLSDLTAVAFLKDPKQKRQNVFGLFSPSRNYHLEATSRKDAEEWVELIRKEARIEEEEEELFVASPGLGSHSGFIGVMELHNKQHSLREERLGSSSPEPSDSMLTKPMAIGTLRQRRPSHTMEYSGNELASHSDMSDADITRARGNSTASITETSIFSNPAPTSAMAPVNPRPMPAARNTSQMSGFNVEQDPERVVWQGYLLLLKSKGGVRQWKDLWVVIRARSIALYKNDAEYSPILIISLESVINAVEIDPVSKSKRYCLQVITEERSYKFCAHNEEMLDKSLGAFKSLLAKRKEQEAKRVR